MAGRGFICSDWSNLREPIVKLQYNKLSFEAYRSILTFVSPLYLFCFGIWRKCFFLWDYLGSKEFLVIVTMTVWKVSFWNNRKWCLRFASLWFIFIQIFQSDYLFHLWEILLLRYSWRWLWSPSLWFLFVQLDLKEMAPSQPSF